MSKLFWTVVALAILLVVVDRVGDFAAERVAADTLQSSQGLDQPPHVSIEGFPFLHQFVTGRYERVRLSAERVPVGSAPNSLTLSRVRLDFRTVTTSKSFDRFRARRARARDRELRRAEPSTRRQGPLRRRRPGEGEQEVQRAGPGHRSHDQRQAGCGRRRAVLHRFQDPGSAGRPTEVSRVLENLFAAHL